MLNCTNEVISPPDMAGSVCLSRSVSFTCQCNLKTKTKNPTMIDGKCTTSANGAPFIDSVNSDLLVFPFSDAIDIEEIDFDFDGQAAGQVAEIEFNIPGKPNSSSRSNNDLTDIFLP